MQTEDEEEEKRQYFFHRKEKYSLTMLGVKLTFFLILFENFAFLEGLVIVTI